MHVGVIPRVADPGAFLQAEENVLAAGLPEGFRLTVHAETPDHATAMCIWDGSSVDAVRESVVGEYSHTSTTKWSWRAAPRSHRARLDRQKYCRW